MSTSKTLLLHVGGPKTGSHALQITLAANIGVLQDLGVDYVQMTVEPPGNGVILHDALTVGLTDDDLDSVVLSYFGRHKAAICSSETLSFPDIAPSAWSNLKRSFERLGVEPQLFMFVRDVYPYCFSLYNQFVKHAGETRSFAAFLHRNFVWHATSLHVLFDVFGDRMHAIHYDSNSKKLFDAFCATLDIDVSMFDQASMDRRPNNSLTPRALDVLLLANQIVGEKHPSAISGLLESLGREKGTALTVDHELVVRICERFGKDVDWVNDTFFAGKPVVKIIDEKQLHGSPRHDVSHQSSEWRALRWALKEISRLESGLDETDADRNLRLIEQIRNLCADKSLADARGFPPDFNPIAYLICNPDLLAAGANPYRHFLRWGKQEGRKWKLD